MRFLKPVPQTYVRTSMSKIKPDKKTIEYRSTQVAKLVSKLRDDLPPGAARIEVHIVFADKGQVKIEGAV